jgi:hypothetical protein
MSSAVLSYYLNTSLINGSFYVERNIALKIFPPFVEESLKIFVILILVKWNRIGFLIDGAIYAFGWFIAVCFHFLYNRFYFSPVISTLIILITLPSFIIFIFSSNENSLRNWLEIEFDAEVKMLQMIRKGKFASTRYGEYLLTIKSRFSPLVVFDMLTYISLFLELSIKAKRNLLLKESGFEVIKIPGLDSYFKEMKSLRKSIGKTGLVAIHPILRMSKKDLWKLSLLE